MALRRHGGGSARLPMCSRSPAGVHPLVKLPVAKRGTAPVRTRTSSVRHCRQSVDGQYETPLQAVCLETGGRQGPCFGPRPRLEPELRDSGRGRGPFHVVRATRSPSHEMGNATPAHTPHRVAPPSAEPRAAAVVGARVAPRSMHHDSSWLTRASVIGGRLALGLRRFQALVAKSA
jgi:hypothetical protein